MSLNIFIGVKRMPIEMHLMVIVTGTTEVRVNPIKKPTGFSWVSQIAKKMNFCFQRLISTLTIFPFGKEEGLPFVKEASMVKYYAAEMAERVTSEALQILGGAGYTKLHAMERYWRDARLTKIFEGTSEIQLRIVSDRLLGKPTQRANA